ncbi:hypothetical protein RP726_14095 [Candidatus Methylospira mobilis]|uniref:hypothetical protein n=1 Tax=Candidatus Methylospira mobilis TaxID=1808979 RepID=UPI0012940EDA|nr:hypothetical protein [Candidatus Methylospira mobilis]WNV06917.1 hypothetical protein RP726_14095 [Candidatus Methylospira mobilis]
MSEEQSEQKEIIQENSTELSEENLDNIVGGVRILDDGRAYCVKTGKQVPLPPGVFLN